MGIYIKGMEMPKDGKVVLIDPWGNVRLYWSKDVVAVGTGLYLCKVSELPPHGRLGDLDAFAAEMKERQIEAGKWLKEAKDHDTAVRADAVLSFLCEVKLTLDKTPTIIPADPEGGGSGNV